MRLRRTRSPLLLLLLPTLAASLAIDKAKPGSVEHLAKDGASNAADTSSTIIPTKPDVGTKDAPVDGLDGKPHAGPFVVESPKKKPLAAVEDLGGKKSLSDQIGEISQEQKLK